jgi:hypothetical protein
MEASFLYEPLAGPVYQKIKALCRPQEIEVLRSRPDRDVDQEQVLRERHQEAQQKSLVGLYLTIHPYPSRCSHYVFKSPSGDKVGLPPLSPFRTVDVSVTLVYACF